MEGGGLALPTPLLYSTSIFPNLSQERSFFCPRKGKWGKKKRGAIKGSSLLLLILGGVPPRRRRRRWPRKVFLDLRPERSFSPFFLVSCPSLTKKPHVQKGKSYVFFPILPTHNASEIATPHTNSPHDPPFLFSFSLSIPLDRDPRL